MSFRPDCPESYQPVGFRNAEKHSINVGDWRILWDGPSTTVTSFDAAHHLVKIAARNKKHDGQSTSQLQDTLMSKHLYNMQRTSSRNAGLRSTLPVPTTPLRSKQVADCSHTQDKSSRARADAASEHDVEVPADEANQPSRAEAFPRRRKISISGRFLQIDKSSPATGVSFDEEDTNTCASRRSGETAWSEDDFN